jgi:hypothetical protein
MLLDNGHVFGFGDVERLADLTCYFDMFEPQVVRVAA